MTDDAQSSEPSEKPAEDAPAAIAPDQPTVVDATADAPPPAPASDEPAPPPALDQPAPPPPAPAETSWAPPAASDSAVASTLTDRPEVAVGGAFAGGLVLALILKRLAR